MQQRILLKHGECICAAAAWVEQDVGAATLYVERWEVHIAELKRQRKIVVNVEVVQKAPGNHNIRLHMPLYHGRAFSVWSIDCNGLCNHRFFG